MAKRTEYEFAIKVAGKVDASLKKATGMTAGELSKISKQAMIANATMKEKFNLAFEDLDKGFAKIEAAAKKAFMVIGTGAAVAIGASTNVGKAFEKQMSTVEAISGSNAYQMQDLTAKAKEMGIKTVFSATESGKAMEYMAMAGWKTGEMMSGIDGIMNLAAASGEDLATTSDIVTDALTAFGLKAKDSAMFSDALAAAATNSNTNVAMLGESFKYVAPVAGALGYSVQDITAALGLMANSGIKSTQAGTSLRTLLSNMTNPTKDMKNAMEQLGVSLVDDSGRMRSFREVLDGMRSGMGRILGDNPAFLKGLKNLDKQLERGEIEGDAYNAMLSELQTNTLGAEKAQVAQLASMLAGQRGMSGLLAMINAGQEDYDKLTRAIDGASEAFNGQGAAAGMAKTRLNNLEGDITLARSAAEGLGISTYEILKPTMREGVQRFTQYIAGMTTQMNAFAKDGPTLRREFMDTASSAAALASPIIELGGWLLKHPRVITSTLAGIGSALLAYKTASTIHSVATGFQKLVEALTNPVAGFLVGVPLAVGAIVALTTAYSSWQKEIGRKDLAKHFGELSLSLEDLQKTARVIVDNGTLDQLETTMNAFDGVDQYVGNVKKAKSTLDKINWEVQMGMGLGDGEAEAYQSAVKELIDSTGEAIRQEQYAMSLSLGLLTNDDAQGRQIRKQFDSFYSSNYEELMKLGTELQAAVNDAFNDGLLTIDEAQNLARLQQQIADMQSQLASADFTASLEIAGSSIIGKLDSESFLNLTKEVQTATDEAIEKYRNAEKEAIKGAAIQLERGIISQQEYDSMVSQFESNYLAQISQIQAKGLQSLTGTIMENYSSEMEQFLPGVMETVTSAMDRYLSGDFALYEWEHNFAGIQSAMEDRILNGFRIDNNTRQAMKQLWKQLAPQYEDQLEILKACEKAGAAVPEAVSQGLREAALVGTLAGDTDAMWYLVGERAKNNPEYMTILKTLESQGRAMPESLTRGITSNIAGIQNAANTLWTRVKGAFSSAFSNPIDVKANLNLQAIYNKSPDILSAEAKRQAQKSIYDQKIGNPQSFGKGIKGYAIGGIIDRPTLATFAEDGPEAAIPLDGSKRSISLWQRAGELLGVLGQKSTVESGLSKLEASDGGSGEVNITYSPNLYFNGNASKQDIVEAGRISQKEFDAMLKQHTRRQLRTAFST